jgi:hypothetical protein
MRRSVRASSSWRAAHAAAQKESFTEGCAYRPDPVSGRLANIPLSLAYLRALKL